MKLTIDTSTDSHKDIEKAIKMLQSVIGKHEHSEVGFEVKEETTANFMNMFDQPQQAQQEPATSQTEMEMPEIEFY
ncbi:hypothetical protein COV18_04420 [Candidatus Woesearchaeota archaeon CG10_big_fil_rev_8_21_14_0_10_37_12]|nr:MAG: hypothetical protein COV18_04420 [Candidatus Woesearchaeota archaeon CG10_big_fil_rev_8_21_14_0_10_37_12]